jgi:Ring finger domain/PA domain
MSIEELLEHTLTTSSKPATPTAKTFLAQLKPRALRDDDFLQLVVQLADQKRNLHALAAAFGPSLAEMHTAAAGETVELTQAPMIQSDPFTGSGTLMNADGWSNRIVFMTRGAITFAAKARLAQEHGAMALVVGQSEAGVWPYVMTDRGGKAVDLQLPVCMISPTDASALTTLLESKSTSANGVSATLLTRRRHLSCPICCEDFKIEAEAVQLPCLHFFHHECIVPWLKQRDSCPTCRYALPAEPRVSGAEAAAQRREQAQSMMFS